MLYFHQRKPFQMFFYWVYQIYKKNRTNNITTYTENRYCKRIQKLDDIHFDSRCSSSFPISLFCDGCVRYVGVTYWRSVCFTVTSSSACSPRMKRTMSYPSSVKPFLFTIRYDSIRYDTINRQISQLHGPRVGFGAHVRYHCRISPPRFLAECRKRRLNQGSFVLLFFRLFTLSDLYLVFACSFSCTVFVFSYCMFIFLYSFVCQYQSSDWLWRPPPKWPILCRVGR